MSQNQVIPLDVLTRDLKRIDARLAELDAERVRLEQRRIVLAELSQQAVVVSGTGMAKRRRELGPNAVEAVLSLARREPGLRPAEIVERLVAAGYGAKATRQKKSLHQTVLNLLNDGRVEYDADRGIVLPKEKAP